jgi:hypothetical protein
MLRVNQFVFIFTQPTIHKLKLSIKTINMSYYHIKNTLNIIINLFVNQENFGAK